MIGIGSVVISMLLAVQPEVAGRIEALCDIHRGNLYLETMGLSSPESGEYWKLLKDRYHVNMRGVAGCIVDENQVLHARGYNEMVSAELDGKYGKKTLERALKEAHRLFLAQFEKPKKKRSS